MIIGVPRERKALEKRVALTPDGAAELARRGHTIKIEVGAGVGSHFSDADYTTAGCQIVDTLAEVWNGSNLVVKVKEPAKEEFLLFREDVVLFDYLHLASMRDVTEAMLHGKVTGIAYELVRDAAGSLPLLEPMSDIAGKLAVLNGAFYLLTQNGGRGVLLTGTPGVPPAHVVIIGAGIAGRGSCAVAAGAGARVTVLDINEARLAQLSEEHGERVTVAISTPKTLASAVADADLLIGAVLIPGAKAPKVVTKAMIQSMRQGSVVVDISIDQGGCVETIRPTSLDNPVFTECGVIHYGVTNMPSQSALSSTRALTAATLPYIIELADKGIERAINESRTLRDAVNTFRGKLTNREVAEAHGLKFESL